MKFTIEQIKQAHAKVKSGADFPNYVQDLIKIGVTKYETYVEDGHTVYFGKDNFSIESTPIYKALIISEVSNKTQFLNDLKNHQKGNTDYPTFCADCAKSGVEKWSVDTNKMTCTYYDNSNQELLVENIPTL